MHSENREKRLLVLIVILLAAAAVLLGGILIGKKQKETVHTQKTETIGEQAGLATAGAQEKPEETKEEDSIKVELRDYRVFSFDDLSFRFVIARIHVSADQPINISLDHFRTSEGINLGNVNSYVSALENNSYYLGRQNVWFSLISEDKECDANIFIPVSDGKLSTIALRTDFAGNDDMTIDLSNPDGTKDMLTYQAEDVITDGKTYQMKVSRAFDISGEPFYQTLDGTDTDYYLPSTTKQYAFKVEVVSTWGDPVVVEQAEYIPSGQKDTFEALDATVHTEKLSNMLGKTVSDNDTGYLLFCAYNPDTSPITYTGELRLKLKGSDSWITIHVDLN